MFYQRLAYYMPAIVDLVEYAGVNACRFDRGIKSLCDEICNAWMRRVAFDNDRAPGGKCRCRVSAS